MHLKIFTLIGTLDFHIEVAEKLTEKQLAGFEKMLSEIEKFVENKENVEIKWLQSSAIGLDILRIEQVSFTQLTAIVSWTNSKPA